MVGTESTWAADIKMGEGAEPDTQLDESSSKSSIYRAQYEAAGVPAPGKTTAVFTSTFLFRLLCGLLMFF
jgi:hypothetical protein